MKNRGGILLDLFIILVVIIGGASLWLSRSKWRPALPAIPKFSFKQPAAAEPGEDLSRRSAQAQATVRELLHTAGVGDKDVVKTYSVERAEDKARWVESTMELSPERPLHTGRFLKRLAPTLEREGLTVVRDESKDGRWILEIGERNRVFQRLVLLPRP